MLVSQAQGTLLQGLFYFFFFKKEVAGVKPAKPQYLAWVPSDVV